MKQKTKHKAASRIAPRFASLTLFFYLPISSRKRNRIGTPALRSIMEVCSHLGAKTLISRRFLARFEQDRVIFYRRNCRAAASYKNKTGKSHAYHPSFSVLCIAASKIRFSALNRIMDSCNLSELLYYSRKLYYALSSRPLHQT